MKLVQLNMNEMKTEEEVHVFLMEQMEFPKHYGKNLDALFDVLTSELPENICLELVRCESEDAPLAAFAKKLENVMVNAAQTVDEKEGKMYAIFADTTPLEYQFQAAW